MKKLKVGIIFFIAIISCALLGTNKVAAACSRGSRVTRLRPCAEHGIHMIMVEV